MSRYKLQLLILTVTAIAGCGENISTDEVGENAMGTPGPSSARSAELDFREVQEENSQEFACDPLVNRPDPNFEYSGNEITIDVHPSFSPKINDPGSEWCNTPDEDSLSVGA